MPLSLFGRDVARGLLPLSLLLVMRISAQSIVPDEEENGQIHSPAIPAVISVQNALNSGCCDPVPSPPTPLSFSTSDKARFYLHRVLDFGSALGPAVEAATVMASPPKAYPDDWRQGAAGFGRNYGAVLGRVQVAEFSRFVVGLGLHEDPRYYPAANRNIGARIVHAIGFTLVDRSDSGHSSVAFGTIVGATAGGFIGNAYLPENYSDLRHVGVRTGIQMGTFAIGNVIEEFAPETRRLTQALNTHFRPNN
jgi:hypothetical protein